VEYALREYAGEHARKPSCGLKIRTVSVRVRLGAPYVTDARGDQLILFTDGLGVGLAIRIKHVLPAIQPRRLKPESTCVTNAEGSAIGELLEVVLCRR
jgi:hypothetical protein